MNHLTHFADYYYNTTSGDAFGTSTTADPMAFAIIFIFALIFIAISYVISALLLARIFKKAGVESWKAWVPVYNNWIMYELGGQKGYWAVLMFVPLINIAAAVIMYIAYYHIGKNLGKSGEFVLLAIFLPLVWLIWLAVDSSTWQDADHISIHPTDTPPTFTPPQTPANL